MIKNIFLTVFDIIKHMNINTLNAMNFDGKYNKFNILEHDPLISMSATSDNTDQYTTQSDILSGISKEMLQEFQNKTLSAPENTFSKNLQEHHMNIVIFNILGQPRCHWCVKLKEKLAILLPAIINKIDFFTLIWTNVFKIISIECANVMIGIKPFSTNSITAINLSHQNIQKYINRLLGEVSFQNIKENLEIILQNLPKYIISILTIQHNLMIDNIKYTFDEYGNNEDSIHQFSLIHNIKIENISTLIRYIPEIFKNLNIDMCLKYIETKQIKELNNIIVQQVSQVITQENDMVKKYVQDLCTRILIFVYYSTAFAPIYQNMALTTKFIINNINITPKNHEKTMTDVNKMNVELTYVPFGSLHYLQHNQTIININPFINNQRKLDVLQYLNISSANDQFTHNCVLLFSYGYTYASLNAAYKTLLELSKIV